MCNVPADQMAMLEKTVREFLDQGRMFTGYDVTIETRDREKVRMRHQDMRGAVHEIQCLRDAMDFGWDDPASGQSVQWARTQVSMPNNQWAFVYHPSNVDPNGYQPRQTSQPLSASQSVAAVTSPTVQAAVPNGQAIAPGAVADSGGENDDGTFSPDYRNRLFIQKKFLQGAGLKAGDECHVYADSSKQLILVCGNSVSFNGGDTSSIRVTTQRVERNGDMRLSSATLKSASLDADKFLIENADEDGTAVIKVVLAK